MKLKEAKRTEQVRAWRESGKSAALFCKDKSFTPTTLYRWSRWLRTGHGAAVPIAFTEVVRTRPIVRAAELVIEVDAARIRVGAGFDPALLADVLAALRGMR